MNIRAALLLALLPLAWSCAPRGQRSGTSAPIPGDPYRITAEELAAANTGNLYDAIVQLRPMWLSPPTPTSGPRGGALARYPVYVNRIPYGDLDALRSLPLADVMSVRLLTPSQAIGEFQRDDMLGAIQVVMRPHN